MKGNSLRADSAALATVRTSSGYMEGTDHMEHLSSKESTFAFWALSNLLLSKTHLRQLQAGHTLRQALQRIHLLSSLCQNANFSSGLIARSAQLLRNGQRPLSPLTHQSVHRKFYALFLYIHGSVPAWHLCMHRFFLRKQYPQSMSLHLR